MGVYSCVFSVLVAFASYVAYQRFSDTYSSVIVKPHKRYDYIIDKTTNTCLLKSTLLIPVGGGTAGCVLAARLSEDPKTRVLLVEAGDHMGYFTSIPLTATAAQQGPNDWTVRTSPQKFSSFGLWDQTQFIPRGKGLGGSGQINFLLHGFGLPHDFDRWSSMGFPGWTLGDLKPYFVKAFGTTKSVFDTRDCSFGYCKDKAPMHLKTIDSDNELFAAFKQASTLLKDNTTVFRKATATVKNGVRYSSYDAYLKPALKRRNLHVLLNTQVVSIRFENRTVTSVFILQNHRDLNNIFVTKEVVLSAGAVKTPQILALSGVGPKDTLRRLKIRPLVTNEAIGGNLHDHMNVPIYVSVRKPVAVTLTKVFTLTTAWEYYWHGKGVLSFPPVSGVEYHNKSALMLFSMGTASERLLRDLSNYHPEVFRAIFPFHNDYRKEGFMFLATCVQPTSRGRVNIVQPSTKVPPVVDPAYLQQGYDVQCIVKAIRRAETLISTEPFQEIGARIHWPRPERCLSLWRYSKEEQTGIVPRKRKLKPTQLDNKKLSNQDKETVHPKHRSPPDEYLQCVVREIGVTGHHVAGTCAGGSVVDSQLRVKQLSGVRIMDASVLPTPISLYPNSVLIAMAERAADIIKGERKGWRK